MAGVPGPNSRYPQSPPPIWPLANEDLAVFTLDRLFSGTHGGDDSAGPRTPTTPAPPPPPPPLGAFGQQLVAKGVALRRPWPPKAPDAP